MKNKEQIELWFDRIHGSFSQQLRAQGWQFSDTNMAEIFEYLGNCIFSLSVRGVITDTERARMQTRLVKKIRVDVVPFKPVRLVEVNDDGD